MTAGPDVSPLAPELAAGGVDHRGSPLPTGAMIATRFMELRKRRGLLAALALVTVGIPTVFLAVRLLLHAIAPKTYGPAGGYDTYVALTAGVLYVFGFIVAAALGCTAGSVDLTDGMFRHLVVTGRSRLALYLARIPAGLAIIVPLVAIGFTIVCAVCVFAAPSTANYDGVSVPAGLSRTQLETWAADNATKVVCEFPFSGRIDIVAVCGRGPGEPDKRVAHEQPGNPAPVSPAQLRAAAVRIVDLNYSQYRTHFAAPSDP
ncbi:MAG TPA: hypothetical protein VFE19_14620 [Jatrophihabitantaceae bacterium]|nr:hypothetical protein [Jatrophihabitantaceae bacterium]